MLTLKINKSLFSCFAFLALVSCSAGSLKAELVATQLNETFFFDFQDYDGSGLRPGGGDGRLDSDIFDIWFLSADSEKMNSDLGSTHDDGLFGGNASATGSGRDQLFAAQTGAGNVALGFEAGYDFISAGPNITIRNQTGQTIDRSNSYSVRCLCPE